MTKKLDTVWREFVTKGVHLVLNNRIAWPSGTLSKQSDNWFNMNIAQTVSVTEQIEAKLKKSTSLYVDIYAEIPRKQSNCEQANKNIILERWRFEFSKQKNAQKLATSMSDIYKKATVLLRSLYTYTILLPSYDIFKKITLPATETAKVKLKYFLAEQEHTATHEIFGKDSIAQKILLDSIDCGESYIKISAHYRKNVDIILKFLDKQKPINIPQKYNMVMNIKTDQHSQKTKSLPLSDFINADYFDQKAGAGIVLSEKSTSFSYAKKATPWSEGIPNSYQFSPDMFYNSHYSDDESDDENSLTSSSDEDSNRYKSILFSVVGNLDSALEVEDLGLETLIGDLNSAPTKLSHVVESKNLLDLLKQFDNHKSR